MKQLWAVACPQTTSLWVTGASSSRLPLKWPWWCLNLKVRTMKLNWSHRRISKGSTKKICHLSWKLAKRKALIALCVPSALPPTIASQWPKNRISPQLCNRSKMHQWLRSLTKNFNCGPNEQLALNSNQKGRLKGIKRRNRLLLTHWSQLRARPLTRIAGIHLIFTNLMMLKRRIWVISIPDSKRTKILGSNR